MENPTIANLKQRVVELETELDALGQGEHPPLTAAGATTSKISGQHPDEADLRMERASYRHLFQDASMGIILYNDQAQVLDVNKEALRILGYQYDEFIRMKADNLIHPEDLVIQPLIEIKDIIDHKHVRTTERRYLCKDGHYIPVELNLRIFPNNTIIAMFQDIRQRKKAEAALQQSEERYRSLVENTQDGYFICDVATGRFNFLNQRMCDLLRYSRHEGLALTLWDVIDAKDHQTMRTSIELQQKSHRTPPVAHTYQAVCKDGLTFRAEISTVLVTFMEKPAIQGLLRDITEKERLQAQLQQAQRLESIGTLAGGVAHDFNNLLMAIQGNSALAMRRIAKSNPAQEKLENILTCVNDASALTRQLLEFGRGGKYEVKATNLNGLIDKTVRMFGRTKKEITVQTHLQDMLWAVDVDQGQIEQVLLNLFVNAWQAMPNGGQIDVHTKNVTLPTAYVKTYSAPPGAYIKVSVTDTGLGMDRATQAKIFEPFFTTKDRSRGTGLGLASAYGIIKNHDGIINVYSEPGKGTTFSLYLPAVNKKVVREVARQDKPLVGAETILLVDDEQMILDVGKQVLDELGYHTLVACGGQEALELYAQQNEKIDLVILDMIMPQLSGGDTFDQLKAMNPHVKTLLSSGYSLNEEAAYILSRGCHGFIQKPFNLDELSHKIRQVLDSE